MADGKAEASGVLDRISRNIAVVGSIIAAVVGFNTALTSCSAQTVARHQTFRQAVDAEEVYWRNLYNDYLSAFRQGTSEQERSARFFALSVLAQRDIPDFREYSLGLLGGGGARKLAQERLASMKNRLNEVLARPESSDPRLAAQKQDNAFVAALGGVRSTSDRQRESDAGDSAPAEPPAVASGVNYLPQTLTRGDPKGWDFDVFWCGGGDSQVQGLNYAIGLRTAQALAQAAARGEELAGDPLGRVRLVMLPEGRQGRIYPARGTGLEIRPETGGGELAVAEGARKLVPGGGSFRIIASETPSRWYLSVFACSAGTPPVGRPRSNSLDMAPLSAS